MFTGDKLGDVFDHKYFRSVLLCDPDILIDQIHILVVSCHLPSVAGRKRFTGWSSDNKVIRIIISMYCSYISMKDMVSYIVSV